MSAVEYEECIRLDDSQGGFVLFPWDSVAEEKAQKTGGFYPLTAEEVEEFNKTGGIDGITKNRGTLPPRVKAPDPPTEPQQRAAKDLAEEPPIEEMDIEQMLYVCHRDHGFNLRDHLPDRNFVFRQYLKHMKTEEGNDEISLLPPISEASEESPAEKGQAKRAKTLAEAQAQSDSGPGAFDGVPRTENG